MLEFYEEIVTRLAGAPEEPSLVPPDGRFPAAVALILRQGYSGPEMFFIHRAAHDQDPWSGHLAFPGGRLEPGEEPRRAAERETLEEVGLDLSKASFLGRLTEISGMTLPVRVACFVYGYEGESAVPVPNEEVQSAFWIALDDLVAPERHVTATVHFDGSAHEVPAIMLPQANIPVLWGLTYRLVVHFLESCRDHRVDAGRKDW